MVRFENVGLRYGLGPEVLRDLSFRIEPHSFQFLTGPSGAGKTSLLRLLFLSLQADARADHPVRPRRRDAVEGRASPRCAAASASCSRISACSTT